MHAIQIKVQIKTQTCLELAEIRLKSNFEHREKSGRCRTERMQENVWNRVLFELLRNSYRSGRVCASVCATNGGKHWLHTMQLWIERLWNFDQVCQQHQVTVACLLVNVNGWRRRRLGEEDAIAKHTHTHTHTPIAGINTVVHLNISVQEQRIHCQCPTVKNGDDHKQVVLHQPTPASQPTSSHRLVDRQVVNLLVCHTIDCDKRQTARQFH